MALFRRKPEDIEAVQWTGDNPDTLREFAGRRVTFGHHGTPFLYYSGNGPGVSMKLGDWIKKSSTGALSVVDRNDFAADYELKYQV
jgi:hypothetical protein